MGKSIVIKSADFSNVAVDVIRFKPNQYVIMEQGTINSNGQPIVNSSYVIRSSELIQVGVGNCIIFETDNDSAFLCATNQYATDEYNNRLLSESSWHPFPHYIVTRYDYINILVTNAVNPNASPIIPEDVIINYSIDRQANYISMQQGSISPQGAPDDTTDDYYNVNRSSSLIYVGTGNTITFNTYVGLKNKILCATNQYATSEYNNRKTYESQWQPFPHSITCSYDYINILVVDASSPAYKAIQPGDYVIYYNIE